MSVSSLAVYIICLYSIPHSTEIPLSSTYSFLVSFLVIVFYLRAVGKVKLGEARKVVQQSSQESEKDPSVQSLGPAQASTARRLFSPSLGRKTGSSIAAALKSRTGLFGGKKKKAEKELIKEIKPKKMRDRIFFIPRNEQTDDEVVDNIGSLNFSKEVSQGFETIVKTASMMQRFCKEKESERKVSIHEGNVKGKLKLLELSPDSNKNTAAIILDSTKFLGKVK